jgi:preprotein translocase subunit SecA
VNAGRPVLVGTTSVEISELLSRMLKMKNIKHQVLNAKLHQKEADIVAEAGKNGTVTIATNMAGRGTDIKLGEGVKDSGGLAIIGTERHDSRRVDRQLRGRAGRQGDPGSSVFFVSLEDELMRLFGSERISKLMDSMGYKEGEVITHSMITKSIERAQKKVEENNFGTRKRLLEYDDVMNQQREVIYRMRRNALFGERLSTVIAIMMNDMVDALVKEHHDARDFESFELDMYKYFAIEMPVNEEEFFKMDSDELSDIVYHKVYETYKMRSELIRTMAMPVITEVFQNQGQKFENIIIPITDGTKSMQLPVNLASAFNSQGKELTLTVEKSVMLSLIDNAWKEHLREMDDLKQSVQNAYLEQKDPLLIYKLESFNVFKTMIADLNREVISFLVKAAIPAQQQQQQPIQVKEAPVQRNEASKLKIGRTEVGSAPEQGQQNGSGVDINIPKEKQQPIVNEVKIGRNDPCPCGSGKKYKSCHGANVNA